MTNPLRSLFRTHDCRALILVSTMLLVSAGRDSSGDTVQLTVSNLLPLGTNYATVVLTPKGTNEVEFNVTANPCHLYLPPLTGLGIGSSRSTVPFL